MFQRILMDSKFNNVFTTLGASNHVKEDREPNDYYATDPTVLEPLIREIKFSNNIWECADGGGHLSNKLKEMGFTVKTSDKFDYGNNVELIDFLKFNGGFNGDIITNPPYKYAQEFVEKALDVIPDGNKVAMFLRLLFLEGQKRKLMFDKYPPKEVLVFSKRQNCAKGGDFTRAKGSALAYAWFIWEKGFKGHPIIKWI